MFGFFFTEQETVTCYEDVARCDVERFKRFFHLMLQHGVYLAPSAFEASFTSLAHGSKRLKPRWKPQIVALRFWQRKRKRNLLWVTTLRRQPRLPFSLSADLLPIIETQ